MQALSAQQLLPIWESGRDQMPIQRALAVLAAACPESSLESLAALSIGRRDASLLQLREWAFGPRLDGVSDCPQCGDRLEFSFRADDIRPGKGNDLADSAILAIESYEISFRLPNSLDLMAIATCESRERQALKQVLLKRCVLQARKQDAEISTEQLPESVVAALSLRMAEADLQADVRLDLVCPGCKHRWDALFDILSFFWREIDAWAGRMVREVHLLASAYGWAEKDILTMTPDRRSIYLSMIAT